MRKITLKLEYDKLYFDDLIFALKSLIGTAKKFYGKNEITIMKKNMTT